MADERSGQIAWLVHGMLWVAAGGAVAGEPLAAMALGVMLLAHAFAAWSIFFAMATGIVPQLPPPRRASIAKVLSALVVLCAASAVGMIWLAIGSLTAHIAQLAIREHFWGKHASRK